MTKEEVIIEISYDTNLTVEDVQRIIDIQYMILEGSAEIYCIKFTSAKFFNAAVAVIIGTLPMYANLYKKTVRFRFEKFNPIYGFFKSVGIYDYYVHPGEKSQYVKQAALPFGRVDNEDKMEQYTDKIMQLAPIKLSEKASAVLSSYFFEIYQNSFTHSKSEIDVFSCGYWMKNQLVFSIYDMGIGIPQNVKQKLGTSISSSECIEWAFKEGTTTLDEKIVTRGLGLNRLEKFVILNKGVMSLYSDDICYTIENQKKRIKELNLPIKGTLIIISIKADVDHEYIVNDERENKDEENFS